MQGIQPVLRGDHQLEEPQRQNQSFRRFVAELEQDDPLNPGFAHVPNRESIRDRIDALGAP